MKEHWFDSIETIQISKGDDGGIETPDLKGLSEVFSEVGENE